MTNYFMLKKLFIPEIKNLSKNKQLEVIENARYNTFIEKNIIGAVIIIISMLVPFLLFIGIPVVYCILKGCVISAVYYPFGALLSVLTGTFLHDLLGSLLIRAEAKRLTKAIIELEHPQ